MKRLLSYSLILILSAFASCSKDENSTSINSAVSNTVTTGTWRISYFFDTGTDETSNFSGYNFTFGSNDVLSASNGTNTYTGSWSITNNNSSDDSLDDLDFNISFTSPANFEELSEDWEILSRTSNKIELKHVSGGNGGTAFLTFEKN